MAADPIPVVPERFLNGSSGRPFTQDWMDARGVMPIPAWIAELLRSRAKTLADDWIVHAMPDERVKLVIILDYWK